MAAFSISASGRKENSTIPNKKFKARFEAKMDA
jgi:hypothetical protein